MRADAPPRFTNRAAAHEREGTDVSTVKETGEENLTATRSTLRY